MSDGVLRSVSLGRWRLALYDRLVSTNDHCIDRAKAGEAEGLAVLARAQTGARGSRGRSWTEPPEGNLALSVLLRPPEGGAPGLWPFVAGLALHDGLEAVSAAPLVLKWPNDLLFDGRKLAGILIERGFGADGIWMVIGFGANLRGAPAIPGRRLAFLAEAGPAPDPETAAGSVLRALDHWCAVLQSDGFAAIRSAWLNRAHPPGTRLVVTAHPGAATGPAGAAQGGGALAQAARLPHREGMFHDIAPDGALLLDNHGTIERVETGEVLLLDGTR